MLKKNIALPLFVVLFIAMTAVSGYLYTQVLELKKTPEVVAQKEVEQLVSQVGKLMVLPEGETPTVATVTDAEKLKEQPFFSKATNGDKVLIYTNSKKAILYRPSTNLLIDVAPVNIGAGQTTPDAVAPVESPTPTPEETPAE